MRRLCLGLIGTNKGHIGRIWNRFSFPFVGWRIAGEDYDEDEGGKSRDVTVEECKQENIPGGIIPHMICNVIRKTTGFGVSRITVRLKGGWQDIAHPIFKNDGLLIPFLLLGRIVFHEVAGLAFISIDAKDVACVGNFVRIDTETDQE